MNPIASAFIALLAICLLVVVAIASDDINMAALKEKMVPSKRHAYTFRLCGKPWYAEITDVIPGTSGLTLTPDPKTALIWCKAGMDQSRLDDELGVYVAQETDSSGKVTFKMPPNSENKFGVNLPPASVLVACKKNALPSDAELKGTVNAVLTIANTEYINIDALKKKLVPTTKLTFTFKLCATPVLAKITDVTGVFGWTDTNPAKAEIKAMVGLDANTMTDVLLVYVVQETKSGKINFKSPPDSDKPHGVHLPGIPTAVRQATCGSKVVSDAERKAIAEEVVKMANAA